MCAAASKGLTSDLAAMICAHRRYQKHIGKCARNGDYDKRTPLHLAASEGKTGAVRFLLSLNNADAGGDNANDDAAGMQSPADAGRPSPCIL